MAFRNKLYYDWLSCLKSWVTNQEIYKGETILRTLERSSQPYTECIGLIFNPSVAVPTDDNRPKESVGRRMDAAWGRSFSSGPLLSYALCFLHLHPCAKVERVRMWETGSEEREGETEVTEKCKQTKQSLEMRNRRKRNGITKYLFEGGCGREQRRSIPLTSVMTSLLPFSLLLFQCLFIAACVSLLECFPVHPPPHSAPHPLPLLLFFLKNECTPTVSIWTIGIW